MTTRLLVVASAAVLAGCPDYVASERAEHAACFRLIGTAHAGVDCAGCHTEIPPVDLGAGKPTCESDTADCMRCHACATHPVVQGFACVNRRCYECHTFSGGAGFRAPG